ncbi:MAG: hydantoinase/oxoprolinase family protein [Desulfohalobiaceae bacterium]|nr:hydantoinase/oxoprolinase family protein [Desulfohalobiaceae bacterium]
MLLGIDVGGTHTDAVLLDRSGLLASAKVETRQDDLLQSIHAALGRIRDLAGEVEVQRFNLSTTLCTNAIVQDELKPVGVMVSAGPGIDPENFRIGDHYEVIRGGLDHRGEEIQALDLDQVEQCTKRFLDQGLRVFAAVGKFSPRNPEHEESMVRAISDRAAFLTAGHWISGQLNFPRRIATSYYNSAVWPIFNEFANSVESSLREHHISPQLNILKADGGTMPLSQARRLPVESIFSGPAASVMGLMALCDIEEDALMLDVGGTTTDVGVFAGGDPLVEAESVELVHRPTLVRAMKTESIGLGGDSAIALSEDLCRVGPRRLGASLACGGEQATLVDALNCISEETFGDRDASIRGMREIGSGLQCSVEEAALRVVRQSCRSLREKTMAMLERINERPVYTVHEFLESRRIEPGKLYIMGGPARLLAPYLSREFGLPVVVPDNAGVANALGAALARPTLQAELFADTHLHHMTVPVLGRQERVSRDYTLKQAKRDLSEDLCRFVRDNYHWSVDESEAEVVEESAMNMVRGVHTVGQDIRVKCQIKPGITPDYEGVVKCICKELPTG